MHDIQLNSGFWMPRLGLGTFALRRKRGEDLVYAAIKEGYRLIDTAVCYGNEREVGNGVRRAVEDGIASRDEIFVTSKLMPHLVSNPDQAIENSLDALSLGYIDLMLLHQPGANEEEIYHAMERAAKAGRLRSIGISNFDTPEEFERIAKIAQIPPAVVQNENHPFHQNVQLQDYVKRYGTVVEAWAPLGGRGSDWKVLENETILNIARARGKTAAQVVIRWQLQSGYIVIPSSRNVEHIGENFSVFDFKLSDEEMLKISELLPPT